MSTKKPRIELVFDGRSTDIDSLRAAVRAPLNELGLPVDWEEWDRELRGRRDGGRYFGPLNILINGEPVADANQTPGVWRDGRGPVLVRAAILKALEN